MAWERISGTRLEWEFDSGTLTIQVNNGFEGSTDIPDYNPVSQPWYEYHDLIEKVFIEDGVTTIGASNFNEFRNLKKLVLGKQVSTISTYAFYGCSQLNNVIIPASVTYLGSDCFDGCINLSTITFLNGTQAMEMSKYPPFDYNSFSTVYFAGSLENWSSFYRKISSYLRLNYSLYYIYDRGICGDNLLWTLYRENPPYNIENWTLEISGTGEMYDYSYSNVPPWFWDYHSNLSQIDIKSGVTSIGNYAFQGCSNLTSVTIPEGVTSIGNQAFQQCFQLKSISLPGSVTTIAKMAFFSCEALTDIIITSNALIGPNILYGCQSLTNLTISSLPTFPISGTFPSNPQPIGYLFGTLEYAESYLANGYYIPNSLKTITITNATTIPANAFKDCQHIKKIIIKEASDVNSFAFGQGSFVNCVDLQSLDTRKVTNISSIYSDNIFEGANNVVVYCYKPSFGTNPLISYCQDRGVKWVYDQIIQGNEATFKLSDASIEALALVSPVQYFYWEIFDDDNRLLYSTNKVFSGDVQMTYSNFFYNKIYIVRAHVVDTEDYEYVRDLSISCWIDELELLSSVKTTIIPLEFDTGVYLKINLDSPQGRSIDFNKIVVKRENISSGKLEHVCTLTPDPISGELPTQFIDYGAKSGVSYMYYLYLTGTEEENNETVTKQYYVEPSSSITPEWDRWMLFTANETNEGDYEVDDMFIFSLNISSGQMTNNGAGQVVNNFTPYPRIQKTTANYWSGTLSGLMGYLDTEEMNYIQNDKQLQDLKTLNISDKPKFLKDRDGHLWRVELTGAVTIDNTDNLCFDLKKKSINWVEIGDASNVSLVLTNKAGAQWLLTLDGYSSPLKTYQWDDGEFWDNAKIWTNNFGGENNG